MNDLNGKYKMLLKNLWELSPFKNYPPVGAQLRKYKLLYFGAVSYPVYRSVDIKVHIFLSDTLYSFLLLLQSCHLNLQLPPNLLKTSFHLKLVFITP